MDGRDIEEFPRKNGETGGAFALVDEEAKRGESIPLHRHPDDMESFYVVVYRAITLPSRTGGCRRSTRSTGHRSRRRARRTASSSSDRCQTEVRDPRATFRSWRRRSATVERMTIQRKEIIVELAERIG